jgi:hypothetical protein
MFMDPPHCHALNQELYGNAATQLGVPGSFIAQRTHALCQVLHQRQLASLEEKQTVYTSHMLFPH